MKAKRLTMIATLVAVAILFVGCKKEKAEKISALKQATTNDMLRFETSAQLFSYLEEAESNNQKNGFVSFGKMADDAYYSIKPEEMFKNMDEVVQFVMDNRDLYQLILCSDGEYMVETRMYDHPFREIANTEGIFQLEDSIYRIIEGGLAYTSVDKINILRSYKDDGIHSNTGDILFYSFDKSDEKAYKCSDSELYNENTIGANRITLKIRNYKEGPFNGDYHLYGYSYLAKPYHLSIGWWGCNRTITGTSEIRLAKSEGFMIYRGIEQENRTVGGNKLKFNKLYPTLLDGIWFINGSHCSASTPDAGTVWVICDMNF